MRLKENESAVDFTVNDYKGNIIRLQDYKGEKTLLIFFLFATCPFCNLKVHELINNYSSLQAKGLSIIAIFESSVENIAKYVGQQNPPFPIVGDPENNLYTQYGLEKSVLGLLRLFLRPALMYKAIVTKKFIPKLTKIDSPVHRLPAEFLIDENLIIKNAHYGTYSGDHLSDQEIDDFLSK